MYRLWLGAVVLFLGWLAAASPDLRAGGISVVRVATGLEQPVYVTAPQGDTSRLFIVEANSGGSPTGPEIARIKILNLTGPNAGTVNATPFLTVNDIPQAEDQGLFGLVFHPNYADNGFFYITYARGFGGGVSRVVRYKVSGTDPDVADPASETLILEFFKPFFNHNGDWLGFSPTDLAQGKYYLYHTTGDGGSNQDPMELAQDLSVRNGKVLRVDVGPDGLADDFPLDPENNYAVPPDNPYIGTAGADPIIWALGLRNPWRASFDRLTGDLYIGNVGAGIAEEVEFQPYFSAGGENYGWSRFEGTSVGANPGPPTAQDQLPMFEQVHGGSLTEGPQRSITGGYVYRGPVLALKGHYVFADFLGDYNFGNQTGRAQIFSFRYDGSDASTFDGTNIVGGEVLNRTAELTPDVGEIKFISSFGEDAAGNLYILDLGNLGTPDGLGLGEIYRIGGAGDDLVTGLRYNADRETMTWNPTPDATAYDVVRGDVSTLAASGGSFSLSVTGCVEDQSGDTQSADVDTPLSGDGFFYLVRAVNVAGIGGSHDSGGPGQAESRDGGVFLSLVGCP